MAWAKTGNLNSGATKAYVDVAGKNVVLLTASATVAAGAWAMCDATAASFVVTLPTGARLGATVHIQETDSSPNTVSYAPGAGDTVEGSTATVVISNNDAVDFISNGAGRWYLRRFLSLPTPGTNMRRDQAGRAQVVDPAAAADIATKNYVDTRRLLWSGPDRTANFTAVANTFYTCSPAATGMFVTLPAAAVVGTVVRIVRRDFITARTLSVQPAAGELMDGAAGTTLPLLTAGDGYEFISTGTGDWQLTGFTYSSTSANNNNSIMRRDGAGRAQVTDPALATDIATKGYVDTTAATSRYEELGYTSTTALLIGTGYNAIATASFATSRLVGASAFNKSTGIYTVPVTGIYSIHLGYFTGNSGATASRLVVGINTAPAGGAVLLGRDEYDGTAYTAGTVSVERYLAAGVQVYLTTYVPASSPWIGVYIVIPTVSFRLVG